MVLKVFGRIVLIIVCILVLIIVAVILFLELSPTVGKLPDEAERKLFAEQASNYYDDRFHNMNEIGVMTGEGYDRSSRRTPKTMIKAEKPELLSQPEENALTFTWFGHSAFVLQMGEVNLLADPVLSKYSSPVSFAGVKRFSEVPMSAEEMPELDVLLLSHDHYDHLDYQSIRDLAPKVKRFVVPLGVDAILRGWGIGEDRICALDWWETAELGGMEITLTPSQHFTGRNPMKGNSTLWGGYYLSNGFHRVYYTGDGGYNQVFQEVREKLGAPELMIAECGQYDPAWSNVHMFPEQTVQAGLDTQTQWMIPVHWGTFCICNHAWDDSILRVTAAAKEQELSIATPKIGETVRFEEIAEYHEAWWEAYE